MRRTLLKPWLYLGLFLTLGSMASCSKDGDGVILFSVEDDKALGVKVAHQTDSTYRAQGQLLEKSSNARVYALLNQIVTRVLNSGQLQYRNEFPWDVQIIKDDKTLNAFATPGGHIYVFSGLIKFLDSEDQLAGVLGHEIAHADRRHTSRQLQQQYGISVLLSVLLGENPNQLAQIATGLGQLKFSRDYEREADEYSVVYLNGTSYYACDGAAGFFIKAQTQGQASTPEFLSTHPDPGSRVEAIQTKADQLGCRNRTSSSASLNELKSLL
ncbi:Peptidase family M48 [Hymenobacter gelipurpurascens]|uniref:Peptidase family M48 n=1 Tax=Hymenobacter gelipurpurascens TaxID=89968 RepID=A0A212TC40_9BACT|nr:M48 family metalloprotease [Hymenobacter gelipurpurascens]SNC63406.1 Peptidase family M48 [Hymenobacter gelipurpurascens]